MGDVENIFNMLTNVIEKDYEFRTSKDPNPLKMFTKLMQEQAEWIKAQQKADEMSF